MKLTNVTVDRVGVYFRHAEPDITQAKGLAGVRYELDITQVKGLAGEVMNQISHRLKV